MIHAAQKRPATEVGLKSGAKLSGSGVGLMVCPPSKANSPFYVHQILWTQNILKHIFGDYLSDFVESIR